MRSSPLFFLLCATSLSAQAGQVPSPSVSVGFGVDTTIADVRDVVHLVRDYLSKPDSSARTRGVWSTATEFDRTFGDLASFRANQGFPATVVGVIPTVPGDSVYLVRILYARGDSSGVSPLALERLIAVREAGAPFRFRLANVFPRVRATWESRSTPRLTFWYVPGQRPNAGRIAEASRFVDSVARLFSISKPTHLDVIVGQSMDDVERAIGLDFFPEPSGPGERGGGLNLGSLLLSGNPAIGEAYLHEFVHAILGPAIPVGSRIMGEGVATWLGGSRGRSPAQMYAAVHRYQLADSTLKLTRLIRDQISTGNAIEDADLLYGSGALIVRDVFRRGGISAVRSLYQFHGDNSALLRAIEAALGVSTGDDSALDKWWRSATANAGP